MRRRKWCAVFLPCWVLSAVSRRADAIDRLAARRGHREAVSACTPLAGDGGEHIAGTGEAFLLVGNEGSAGEVSRGKNPGVCSGRGCRPVGIAVRGFPSMGQGGGGGVFLVRCHLHGWKASAEFGIQRRDALMPSSCFIAPVFFCGTSGKSPATGLVVC